MKLLDSNKKCRIEFGHCRILNSFETLSFQFARYWLGGKYNWFCQPVDYSRSEDALYVRKIIPVRSWGLFCDSFVIVFFQMLHVGYAYYLSKFVDFFDTFCFVARKKFSHLRWAWQHDPIQYWIVGWVTQQNCSLLHVVHHGILPLSCWPGARWFIGGHASFFSMLNSFVHVVMYTYYMIAAMGPEYQVERALQNLNHRPELGKWCIEYR